MNQKVTRFQDFSRKCAFLCFFFLLPDLSSFELIQRNSFIIDGNLIAFYNSTVFENLKSDSIQFLILEICWETGVKTSMLI